MIVATRFARRGELSLTLSLLLVAPLVLLLAWAFFLPIGRLLLTSVTEPSPTLENYVRLSGMIRKATISADWRLVDKLIGSQTRLARELGLTPSSRVSIPATPASEDMADDLERFKRDDTDLEPCRGERLRDTD